LGLSGLFITGAQREIACLTDKTTPGIVDKLDLEGRARVSHILIVRGSGRLWIRLAVKPEPGQELPALAEGTPDPVPADPEISVRRGAARHNQTKSIDFSAGEPPC
jgi:hypothetical protein